MTVCIYLNILRCTSSVNKSQEIIPVESSFELTDSNVEVLCMWLMVTSVFILLDRPVDRGRCILMNELMNE